MYPQLNESKLSIAFPLCPSIQEQPLNRITSTTPASMPFMSTPWILPNELFTPAANEILGIRSKTGGTDAVRHLTACTTL
ncbi:hypothetical protein [Bacillus phage Carmen17]|uniref:Uncharacterized protein n=1 Tax=Bacillus phage Carmen17 TaxID=2072797 RepID=A0A2I7QIL3_9CAUD|nr:hypothetical protein HWB53_gp17 [Bacillus phage Carmen17]AUR81241.1 hypothetical protein [Bacillus phage Carmen17]